MKNHGGTNNISTDYKYGNDDLQNSNIDVNNESKFNLVALKHEEIKEHIDKMKDYVQENKTSTKNPLSPFCFYKWTRRK